MSNLLELYTHVDIIDGGSGTIIGYGWHKRGNQSQACYLVEVSDGGFWDEHHASYVTIIVVHPDNIAK